MKGRGDRFRLLLNAAYIDGRSYDVAWRQRQDSLPSVAMVAQYAVCKF